MSAEPGGPLEPRVTVAQYGARMHYAVPTVLYREGFLHRLFTDAYAGPGSWLHPIFRSVPDSWLKGPLKRLADRAADIPADKVVAYNTLGFKFVLALNSSRDRMEVYREGGSAFLNKIIADKRAFDGASMVYSYSRISRELFECAIDRGIYRVLEQQIAPIKVLSTQIEDQVSRWPGWPASDHPRIGNLDYWLEREQAEWELADRIIAPSAYVRSELINEGASPQKIRLIPYAVSLNKFAAGVRRYTATRPIRILFVGSVNLRKGIPYLLEALKRLGPKQVEARILGSVDLNPDKLSEYRDVAHILGRVPRSEVARHYAWADLFVLPSICEGSATVTYEARAAGLPVIATPNTGAWIDEGRDGIAVPVANIDALVDAIQQFRRQPEMVENMSKTALENAQKFSWDAYAQRLRRLVLETNQIAISEDRA